MIKTLFHYFFKKLYPIRYARYIGVKLGKNCRLINVNFSSEPYLIELGDHVSATAVRFETHDGGVWVMRDKYPNIDVIRPIKVGNNVFIGFGSILLPGITIGDNVVIGAHSVVSKDIPSNCVAVGVPSKVIKSIQEYELKQIQNSDNTKNLNFKNKRQYFLKKFNRV